MARCGAHLYAALMPLPLCNLLHLTRRTPLRLFGAALAIAIATRCTGTPRVGVDADIGSSRPIAVNLAATQPVTLNAALGMDKGVRADVGASITVTVEGLVVPYEGTFITEPLVGQINDGDSQEYVAALLGKPDFEATLGDGSVIWRWKYRPVAQGSPVFSLFGGGDSKEPSPDHITVFTIFRDGKLTRKWRG
jgi:hypothetical protein